MRKALLLVAVFALASTASSTAQVRPIRGFPDDAVAAQRLREEQFRKVPDSARLKEYMEAMAGEPKAAVLLHHRYTISSTFVTGDFLAGAAAWTGLAAGEVMTLLRGTSPISTGFASEELDVAAKAIMTSEPARAALDGVDPAEDVLAVLARSS